MMFDLPEPLGPDIVVKPLSKGTTVGLPNDFKLSSSISLIRKSYYPLCLLMMINRDITDALDYTLDAVSSLEAVF